VGLFNKEDKPKLSQIDKYKSEISEFLLQGEVIENIYPLIIDYLCITSKRIIFVDKVISLKEPKTTIYSVPYKNIMSVGLEINLKAVVITDELKIITLGAVYNLKFLRATGVIIKDIYNELLGKIL